MNTQNAVLFMIATRMQYRFPISGSITVEDVWQLPLKPRQGRREPSLEELAQTLHERLEALPKRSFVDDETATTDPENLSTKLEIVKIIIQTKKTEAQAKQGAVAKASKLNELDALIARRKQDEMAGKSVEELEAMRNAILNGNAPGEVPAA